MSEPGSAGTAGRDYKVEKPVGRHRAPPPPPPQPDRWSVPIGAAAALLTAASLIALAATAVAPDATAAGNGATVSTATRAARTVQVPLTVGPLALPSIGAEGAWDPETTPPEPAETTVSAPVGTRSARTAPQAVTQPLVATTASSTTEQPPATTPEVTTAPPADPTTAAASSEPSSATTEETPVTETSEPTPTDVQDVIDEVLGEKP